MRRLAPPTPATRSGSCRWVRLFFRVGVILLLPHERSASAHGADVVMMEASLEPDGVDAVVYLGQKPVMRLLFNDDSRPVNDDIIRDHERELIEHVEANIGFRTDTETCRPGAVLRVDKDPDGQAVRLVRRYGCKGALEKGVEATFHPFPVQPYRVFLFGVFFAGAQAYVHTFTGKPAWIRPGDFNEPARADRLAVMRELFPPRAPASHPKRLWWAAGLGAAVLAVAVGLVRRKRRAAAPRRG